MSTRKPIILRRPAICADCGSALRAGTRARYYGASRIYGMACHGTSGAKVTRRPSRPIDDTRGALSSYYNPQGAYLADGTYLGKLGSRCEDAPCCGCCS